jgi:hypothetical protein
MSRIEAAWQAFSTDRVIRWEDIAMSKISYSSMTIDELPRRFEKACLEQYETWITDDIDKYNADFDYGDTCRIAITVTHAELPFSSRRSSPLLGLR